MFAASKTSRLATVASDPFFDNVSLLLESSGTNGAQNNTFIDSSTNNFTITRNGNTTQGAFSPFGENWSNYFDGAGDYFTLPSNQAQFSMATGDFTIEMWVNVASFAAERTLYDTLNQSDTTGNGRFAMRIPTDRSVQLFTGSGQVITSGGTLQENTWNHIAYTRQSSNGRLYVNGIQVNTTNTDTRNYVVGTVNRPIIGVNGYDNGTGPMFGYISNLRVVKGTALYTANFTPSTVPLQPVQNTSLLTCRDSNIVDDSANNFTINRFGDVSVQKFGPFAATTLPAPAYGAFFDGTGDYITAPANAAFQLTGDFTLEAWVYHNAVNTFNNIFGSESGVSSDYMATRPTSVSIRINNAANIVWTASFVTGRWYHIAVTRSSNLFRAFVDGAPLTLSSGNTTNSSQMFQTGGAFSVARTGSNTGANFNGYISNARVVKGQALYTSAFTPSTVPLTTTSQGATASNVSLLTCQSTRFIDNSTNNFAITAFGESRPSAFSPFTLEYASQQPYTPSVFGGSMYFDGFGDSLTLASNAAFALPGDFTFETWMYPTAFVGQFTGTILNIGTFQTGLYIRASLDKIDVFIVGAAPISANRVPLMPTPNCWYHLAVVRRGSTLTLYVNGISGATATNSTSIPANTVIIGISAHDAQGTYSGYFSGMRLLKDTALYTSNFVPQNAPPTPVTNTSLLLNGTNAGIYDASTLNNFETVGNAQVSTSIRRYGLSSIAFDGSGDSLDVKPTTPNLFSQRGAYTIEMWIYPTNLSVAQYFYSQNTGNFLQFAISSSGFLQVDRSGVGVAITSSSSLTINTWQYVTLVSDGTNLRLYVDGVQTGSTVSVGTQVDPSSQIIRIGAYQNSGGAPTFPFYGNIQDFRITRGIARYTTTFTPPTAPLPDF